MLHKTNGIVLRSVKYGETSLVVTVFTADFGLQAYMVQGVRKTTAGRNKASYFQLGMLLDMVVYMQPNKNVQRIREFTATYIYSKVHEDVVRNSVLLFSCEVLLRLLPEQAPLPELFHFAQQYLIGLDKVSPRQTANMPLYFLVQCSRFMGYEPKGNYSEATPHLDLHEGEFSNHTPSMAPFMADEDARALNHFLIAGKYDEVMETPLKGDVRLRLIDWYIAYLQQHTQHLGNIRSLQILRTIFYKP